MAISLDNLYLALREDGYGHEQELTYSEQLELQQTTVFGNEQAQAQNEWDEQHDVYLPFATNSLVGWNKVA